MGNHDIFVVEDDEDIQELIRFNLVKEGFHVSAEADGIKALKKIREKPPALVILDLMLPGMDGLSICRELRAGASTRSIPVLMLTAKSEEADIVAGLEVGADDYVAKPFSPRVLTARVRALLRRKRNPESDTEEMLIKRGQIVMDIERHRVTVKGKPADLTHTEFLVLKLLAQRPGIVFSRYQIVDGVRGADYPVTDRSVDVQIVSLRRKLGSCSDSIETVRGAGYRFKQP